MICQRLLNKPNYKLKVPTKVKIITDAYGGGDGPAPQQNNALVRVTRQCKL